jgi:hypothetical protein
VQPFVLLAVALALSAAAIADGPLFYELRFGATPTSPIGPPVPCAHPRPGRSLCPYLEPDYVPDYESVVPRAIQSCGGSFDRFEALTEGGERAIFSADRKSASAVTDCIRRQVPQGHVAASGGSRP